MGFQCSKIGPVVTMADLEGVHLMHVHPETNLATQPQSLITLLHAARYLTIYPALLNQDDPSNHPHPHPTPPPPPPPPPLKFLDPPLYYALATLLTVHPHSWVLAVSRMSAAASQLRRPMDIYVAIDTPPNPSELHEFIHADAEQQTHVSITCLASCWDWKQRLHC